MLQKKINNTKKGPLFFALITILLTLILIINLQLNKQLTINKIRSLLQRFGSAAPLIYVLLCSSTTVFAPLVIMPLWITGIIIFPYPQDLIYIYVSNLLGHSVNFLIARKWGRQLIRQFIGEKGIQKVDQFTSLIGWKMIIIARLFGGSATDYISYALGLTDLSFLLYLFITAACFFPWIFLNYYLVRQAVEGEPTIFVRNFTLLGIIGALTTVVLGIFTYHKNTQRQKDPPTKKRGYLP